MTMPWHKRQWGDKVIVPGVRIGGFELLKQPAEFLPDDSEATIADWSGRCSVGVHLDEARGLIDATTGDPSYQTEEGFHIGTSLSDVIAAWGAPDEDQQLEEGGYIERKVTWHGRGIDFAVKDGKVLYIGVFPPEAREQPAEG